MAVFFSQAFDYSSCELMFTANSHQTRTKLAPNSHRTRINVVMIKLASNSRQTRVKLASNSRQTRDKRILRILICAYSPFKLISEKSKCESEYSFLYPPMTCHNPDGRVKGGGLWCFQRAYSSQPSFSFPENAGIRRFSTKFLRF